MPRRSRSHSSEFKRQGIAEDHAGETLHALGWHHDLSRNLIRIWIEKTEVNALDEDAAAAELIPDNEARIAVLDRLVGRLALVIEFPKGVSTLRTPAEKRAYIRDRRRANLAIQQ
jgi:transposase-like protein